jgi:hypothetical protein
MFGAAGRIDGSRRPFVKAPHSVCPMRGLPFPTHDALERLQAQSRLMMKLFTREQRHEAGVAKV